jgi:hypothetical protein
MDTFFHGIDIGANHGAIVTLNASGCIHGHHGFTFKPEGKKLSGYTRLEYSKTRDKQQDAMSRFFAVCDWLMSKPEHKWFDRPGEGHFVSIEDYAFAGKAGQHSIAQVGGMLRYVLMVRGKRAHHIRLHAPGTINLYALGTTKNAGDKSAIRDAVLRMHHAASYLPEDSEGDMIDAYIMACIVYLEHEVRAGRVSLESLTDGQRQVFLRVTKAFPENLLARSFLR